MTLVTGIERIRIRNYRVLRGIELSGLTPVTALLGPNGSGKSTVFDALAFLAEAFRDGLARAWEVRGGIAEIGTHGSNDLVEIDLTCRVGGATGQYRVAIDHVGDRPVVAQEELTWRPPDAEQSFDALKFNHGVGVVSRPGASDPVELAMPELLGVGLASQVAANAEISDFHRFVAGIAVSDPDVDAMRKGARVQRATTMSSSGGNIGAVIETLRTDRPDQWAEIVSSLRRYVPKLADVEPFRLGDGSWIVRLREEDREERILPDDISDGTLQLLGYLVGLRTDTSVPLVEEPENQVHPGLHYLLAEEMRSASGPGQVVVATHAPQFVDALRPDEVWMMFRDEAGSAQARRAADIPRLVAMVDAGGSLGDLWNEGFFDLGDPPARPGRVG